MPSPAATWPRDGSSRTVDAAVERLLNLHDGEGAIPDVVAWGDIAIPRLESLLRGPSEAVPHTRCWAADALAGIGSPSAIAALLRALRDTSARTLPPQLQEAESVVIGRIAHHLSIVPGATVSDALLETLRAHPSSQSCVRAVAGRLDGRALPLLVGCLFEDSVRTAAAQALTGFGSLALPYLAQAVALPSIHGASEAPTHIEGRRAAAEALGEWLMNGTVARKEHALEVQTSLATALHDPQRCIRLAAAIALSRTNCEEVNLVAEVLVLALEEATWPQLEVVMRAIEDVGTAALCMLVAAIASGVSPKCQRIRAVTLLGRMRAVPTIPLLATLAAEADGELRLASIRALARMLSVGTALIARFLNDPIPLVRRTAFVTLHRRRALTTDCALRFLADPDRHIQRAAHSILRRQGRQTQPFLTNVIRSLGAPAHGLGSRWRLWRRACALAITVRFSRRQNTAH
jgi:HEAT repeat protein